jgi:hypothetical protein
MGGNRMIKRSALIFALAMSFCLSSWALPADAYERGRPWRSDQPWEKFSVTFGYFLTSFQSDVSLTGSGAGVVLNLEDILGLDSTTSQFRLDAQYRAWRRHHFHFSYYDLSRNAEKILEVSIPEEEIEAGAFVQSTLDITMYKIGYSFSFWNDDRIDLGAGLGFYVMELAAGLNVFAEGSVGGEGGSIAEQVLAEDTTLPLPVFGLRGNIAITKRVFLKQSIEFFYISLSGFEGLLLDFSLALEGHICRFFGLGAGFNFLRVDIEGDGGSDFLGGGWNGKLNFDYSGVFVYGKFFF